MLDTSVLSEVKQRLIDSNKYCCHHFMRENFGPYLLTRNDDPPLYLQGEEVIGDVDRIFKRFMECSGGCGVLKESIITGFIAWIEANHASRIWTIAYTADTTGLLLSGVMPIFGGKDLSGYSEIGFAINGNDIKITSAHAELLTAEDTIDVIDEIICDLDCFVELDGLI